MIFFVLQWFKLYRQVFHNFLKMVDWGEVVNQIVVAKQDQK